MSASPESPIPEAIPLSLDFVPLDPTRHHAWSRPARFGFFEALAVAPIGDTELLHLSHYAPVAVRLGLHGPEVVLVLHPGLIKAELLNGEKHWVPPYAPMALRSLPFRSGEPGAPPHFAPSLCDPEAEALEFHGADNRPTREFAYVLEMLQRLERGGARLAQAARLLLAADCLVPLVALADHPGLQLLVVSEERLRGLAGARAAALTADANLPFELAGASLFSQRWLANGALQDVTPAATRPPSPRAGNSDYGMTDTLDEPLLMDDSSLFSIEDFLVSVRSDNDIP